MIDCGVVLARHWQSHRPDKSRKEHSRDTRHLVLVSSTVGNQRPAVALFLESCVIPSVDFDCGVEARTQGPLPRVLVSLDPWWIKRVIIGSPLPAPGFLSHKKQATCRRPLFAQYWTELTASHSILHSRTFETINTCRSGGGTA